MSWTHRGAAGRWGRRAGESAPTVDREKENVGFSLQVGIRIICMWATSAPRGLPFSVLKGESAQTMAVFFFFFLDGRKAPFPCMRWYNTLELVVHRCLASVTASFFNTAGRLSLIPSLSLSPFSPYGSGCSFNRGFWRLFITAGGPNWHKVVVVVVVKFSVFLFTVKITH